VIFHRPILLDAKQKRNGNLTLVLTILLDAKQTKALYSESKVKKKNGAAAQLGRIGGKARARSLSAEDRAEIARQGGLAKARKSAGIAAEQNGQDRVSPTTEEN
jgi:hypothetical protein